MPRRLYVAIVAAVLSTGCFEILNQTVTNPDPSIRVLGGKWVSTTPNASGLLNTCTNFSWTVTQQASGSSLGAGTFTATCFGVMQITGSATATSAGSNVNWTASGVANGAAITDCAISLNGTAAVEDDKITLNYSGLTCMGPVSGTEVLTKA